MSVLWLIRDVEKKGVLLMLLSLSSFVDLPRYVVQLENAIIGRWFVPGYESRLQL